MWTQAGLAQRLESARVKLTVLLAEQTRIRDAIGEIRGRIAELEDLLGDVPGEESPGGTASRGGRRTAPGPLKDGTRIARAYAYLHEAGESVHVGEILAGIGEQDSARKRDGLCSQINRHVQAGRFFARDDKKGPRYFRAIVDEPGAAETAP